MSDLTAKFNTLSTALTTRLDTIIERLDRLHTALTTANGNIDAAPIVAAINNLRGDGPDNTLYSVNQSIWNLAGPAPGRNLVDLFNQIGTLYTLFNPGQGITPYNLMDNIYLSLAALQQGFDYGQGMTPYNLLDTMYLNDIATKDILTRIIAQLDTSVVTPTMKDLLLTINEQSTVLATNSVNPLFRTPPNLCPNAFVSTGTSYISVSAQLIESITYASWPSAVPAGFDMTTSSGIAAGQVKVYCNDWTKYRIYVASKAPQFGVEDLAWQRFATNQWITLSGDKTFTFYVNGSEALKVYICAASATSTGYRFTTELANASWYITLSYAPLQTVNNPVHGLGISQNLAGWTVKHLSGDVLLGLYADSGTAFHQVAPGQTYTFSSTTFVRCMSFSGREGYGPVTYELCPPASTPNPS